VSILERYAGLDDYDLPGSSDGDGGTDRAVRGLARLVQVSPTVTLVDLSLHGLAAGRYRATIQEFGDIKHGAASTGRIWGSVGEKASRNGGQGSPRGLLGNIELGADGRGGVFLDKEFQLWEVIGRALVVSREEKSLDAPPDNDEHTVVGVIARSAGMWDNDKTVCSCTGKTLWEERAGEAERGMF